MRNNSPAHLLPGQIERLPPKRTEKLPIESHEAGDLGQFGI